jgi:hypothetical protein
LKFIAVQKEVPSGRIDIVAEDKNGATVVIELKVLRVPTKDDEDEPKLEQEAKALRFTLERDLESALQSNMEQLEQTLNSRSSKMSFVGSPPENLSTRTPVASESTVFGGYRFPFPERSPCQEGT